MLQARQLRRAMAASSSNTTASFGAVADVQRLLDEAVAERDSLAAQLREVQVAAAAAEGARDRASDEAEREREDRLALQQQLEALREGLDEGSASAAAADARVVGLQVCATHCKPQGFSHVRGWRGFDTVQQQLEALRQGLVKGSARAWMSAAPGQQRLMHLSWACRRELAVRTNVAIMGTRGGKTADTGVQIGFRRGAAAMLLVLQVSAAPGHSSIMQDAGRTVPQKQLVLLQ